MVTMTVMKIIASAIGSSKNLLDLFSSCRSLLIKKEVVPEVLELDNSSQKRSLTKVYNTIAGGKELIQKILVKLCIKYIFYLLVLGSLVYLTTDFIPQRGNFIYFIPIVLLLAVLLIIPSPLKVQVVHIDWAIMKKISGGIFDKSNAWYGPLTESFSHFFDGYRRIWQRGLLSGVEEEYMSRYIDLCAIKDSIEMYILVNNIQATRGYIYDGFGRQIRDMLLGMFIKLVQDGRLNIEQEGQEIFARKQEEVIVAELQKLGVPEYHKVFYPGLYRERIAAAYGAKQQQGIEEILARYW